MYESIMAGIIAFLVVFLLTPEYIKRAKKMGLSGADMNKKNKPVVAESGGVIVFLGTLVGLLLVAGYYFFLGELNTTAVVLLSLVSLSMVSMISFTDDLGGWKKGIARWKKPFITVFAVIPLIPFLLNRMNIEILGWTVNLPYLFYPLILVPIGFVGATNAFNLLAGFNGLETGLGLISTITLAAFAYNTEFFPILMIPAFTMAAFLWYNRYPSKVFPGNTLTYFLGGLFAIVAVLGHFQTITIMIMLPYFIEAFIKAREIPYILKNKKSFRPECFGKVLEDGSLEKPYKEIWSFTHVIIWLIKKIKGKCYENDVTVMLLSLQVLWCMLLVLVFL
jgi:UDP-N-acetylglucosamine--dolichyl-phosphate N-acetylglucosaminephosphotransferase